jgi:hypothetical protein
MELPLLTLLTVVGAERSGASLGSGPSSCPYSAECVEGEFCEVELPRYGVLRSSPYHNSRKFIYEMPHSGGRIGPSEPL